MYSAHSEPHLSSRNNWLRAGVLGANDGLISTASLLMGMVAGQASMDVLTLTALAAIIGGALSMGAGEYISVSSQADTEKSDLAKEAYELKHNPERELVELTNIYKARGLDDDLAHQVAVALTKHDALEAHARDEIGLSDALSAKPLEAAMASAASFIIGAVLPLISLWLGAKFGTDLGVILAGTTLVGLALLGYTSAKLGGARVVPAMARVLIWGVFAMAATALIGKAFGVAVA
ncbi:VIT family protein [Moraxella sp. FZLJ2107]|uniref:VIT1/CCC1 transporter family protein n=1 Tax=unclassified Moraxella TaxID=2685852 RepID=UPI00209BEDEA|nr:MULTISPECIES: VIT family protein [unclassified Moraxella]USZ13897.1 VIT family protein [Moraxella sp. FZFQ2102]UTO04357.1 VIT family protein [Moraxella sp. FZLJ2107]UTO23190.1 VIT family protein [Moraxella sp. FZLJ2109]